MARPFEKMLKKFARAKNNNKVPEMEIPNNGAQVSSLGYNLDETISTENITQSLLTDLRNETDTGEQIELIVSRDPDVSMAVWTFQKLAYQGMTIEIRDLKGNRLTDAEDLFNRECSEWNKLSNDGLDGIVENLQKTALLYNIMMIEVVVGDEENTFKGIYIIDPRTLEWTLESRDGENIWICTL